MEKRLEVMERTYRRFLAIGMGILLLAFATMILRPFGESSLILALVFFVIAFVPLEFARRIARRMAILALRNE
ncbi:hypothetical protein A3L12_00440 [Thermococcus sp. P6]|uniref:hypothetical protein n=1 Tax=Thermococcus sp. P6 TaxID=122420 RepID=UPI000B5A0B5D|nr:hypothetical protein [Thermococcus sp. P6]ASJ09875.1 hypothetical protein A3L12_00440 [Thermococcus sp. P6]